MEKYGSVKDGRLTIGQCTYSFVVIPDCDTLDSSTAALLKDYLSQGAADAGGTEAHAHRRRNC